MQRVDLFTGFFNRNHLNHVKCSTASSASDGPAWFVGNKQETDGKFSEQEQAIEQQGTVVEQLSEEIKQQFQKIKRLTRTVKVYVDLQIRKLKELVRARILQVLQIQQTPSHWIRFLEHLTSQQHSVLRAHQIRH